VVLRLEAELGRPADVLEDLEVVLAAGGHALDDEVGDGAVGGVKGVLGGDLLGLGRLDVGGELLAVGEQLRTLRPVRLADLPAERLVLGAQGVGGGDRAAPPLVCRQQRIHGGNVLTAGALGGAHPVGVVAQRLEVDHGRSA